MRKVLLTRKKRVEVLNVAIVLSIQALSLQCQVPLVLLHVRLHAMKGVQEPRATLPGPGEWACSGTGRIRIRGAEGRRFEGCLAECLDGSRGLIGGLGLECRAGLKLA